MFTSLQAVWRSAACLLIAAAAGLAPHASHARPQAEAFTLALGGTVEVEMAGGETRLFRIAVSGGQYLRVVVLQRGIDVAVALVGPGQKRLLEVDSPNGNHGPEPVSAVVEESGEYTIEVRAPDKKAATGRFEVRVEALREPTPADISRASAERSFAEASRLISQPDARQEALKKLETLLPAFGSLQDRDMEVLTLNRLGTAYNSLGQPHKALGYYDRALSVSKALGDDHNEARILNNIGGAYDILGEPQKALGYYTRALALWETLGNAVAQGDTLNNIGVSYYNLGELQRGLDYYNRALPLRQGRSDARREADTLDNIALVYIALGEPQQALEYLRQALELRRAAKDAQGEANSLNQLGYAYVVLGETAKALDYYNRALPLRRAADDRRGEGVTLRNIGAAYTALGQPWKAVEQHEQALKLLRAIGSRREEAYTLLHLGKAYDLSGEVQKGVEYYAQALSIFQALSDRLAEAKARQSIAEAESARGNFSQARGQIEAAISIIEAMRAQVLSQQLRTSFFASRQDAYEFEIDLLMRMHSLEPAGGYDAAALEMSERARARGLLEMLAESGLDVRQGVDPALLERESELSGRLSAKAARLVSLLGQQNRQEQAAVLKREVGALEEEHQQVLGDIRRRSPHYAAITQPQPLGLREIQQLLDPETLLLEYSLGSRRSYLWAVTRDRLRSFQLPGRERVEQAARRLYELVTARSVRNKGESALRRRERISRADLQTPEAAGELSRLVLGPAGSELEGKRLVVVADGALQYIPFAMLPVPNGEQHDYRPLIVGQEVVSLPSASTLAVQRRELGGRNPAPNNIALIADPVFDSSDQRVVSKTKRIEAPTVGKDEETAAMRTLEHLTAEAAGAQEGQRIARLPYTRLEAEQIIAVSPGALNLRALDFRASLATALGAELHKYRYVHFATHGYIDSEKPALSAVVLSLVNERGEPQDGLLKTQEIYNLNLAAELVVLSACQTGLGREIRGEGLVGLTRGFMYAGAARIIVSLWNVSDKGTADLMSRLYKGMIKGGLRPTAALRAAQLELFRQKQWQSPYYWAAFVQQGEWR
ncbi:MAG TPA: CHAT domain-containing tetratricopeptide repeat protein [Pyrinomonadaceae bacterium]|jgi:CHAT domain-containing protein/tetratricopeptide (TPR) repeat protein